MLRSSRPLGVTQPGAPSAARTPQQQPRSVGMQCRYGTTPTQSEADIPQGRSNLVVPKGDTPFPHQFGSRIKSHPLIGDGEATPRHPYVIPKEKDTPMSSRLRPRPLRTPKNHTSSAISSRPTPFRSNLRPPSSSITRPSQAPPPPSTPSCLCRHDNQRLNLPTGILQSGGGALRRVNSSYKQRQQTKVRE